MHRLDFAASVTSALFSSALLAQPAPLVDHHQHFFSPAITAQSDITPVFAADIGRFLDDAGIQRAAVLSIAYQYGNPNKPAVEDEYAKVKAENDWTSQQVALYPDRLRGLCSFNPLKDYALQELARCADDPNLRHGLKLHFGNSDVDVEDPGHRAKLQEIFGAANTRGMAIVLHVRPSVTMARPYGAAQARVFLDEVLPFAPNVPVQIAHLAGAGGYDDPAIDDALSAYVEAINDKQAGVANLYFDVSGVAGLGDWEDRKEQITSRIRQLGIQRILFGSDGTADFLRPEDAWALFRELPLSAEEFAGIAGNIAPYMK